MFSKSTICLLSVLILSMYMAGNARAEYRFNDGTKIEIQWYEKEGEILDEHVCFNYMDNISKHKECRIKAVEYFKEECEYYNDKINNTPDNYKYIYEPEVKKFCSASENYQP